MKKILILAITLLPFIIFSQHIDWRVKVEKPVLDAAANTNTDFIVLMAEQADVSEAYLLRTKEEKGTFVFGKLKETADRTQTNVAAILIAGKKTFRSYRINNTIWAKADLETIRQIALLPEVKSILYNPSVKLEEPTKNGENTQGARALEWGISHINADDVWALAGAPKGQNVVVGGQDTGYQWDHPALKNKYRGWTSSANHNYNWHDAIHTIDSHNSGANPCGLNQTTPCDDDNHGTHTMGTMIGDDGAGNQIGVAPDAKWIGCRNMERGWGTPATYTECFDWFLAPTNLANTSPDPSKAPHVINNSWGCPASEGCTTAGTYALMEAAVNSLTAAGVVVVVSAGNSGSACSTVNTPAAIFQNSFTVGASDINDAIAGFSSRGPAILNGINRLKPDVAAPGVNIRSSVAIPPNTYVGGYNGTSMAGPHVAGAVALIISAKPAWAGNVSAITTVLKNTSVQPSSITQTCGGIATNTYPNNIFGYGRIDVLAAVSLALLPIKLSHFSGKSEGNGNRIFWTSELEVNSDFFQIEKSDDGRNFISIGKKPASTFNIGEKRYDFFDADVKKELTYYRLKQVDKDGSFEYSTTISVRHEQIGEVKIGPNPTMGNVNVAIQTQENTELQLSITNINGQILKIFDMNLVKGKNEFSLNIEALPKGIYHINGITSDKSMIFSQLIALVKE